MTLPKKTRLERLLEWGYRHKALVHHIMRGSFKFRMKKSPFLVDWKKGIKLLSIGNSHIDAAWLWRKEDTRTKKINVTFDRALLHMAMYPDFTYTQSQAVYYAWTKELYPEIWNGIKQRIKEGQWEVLGGDWVECDANIPCGESLIRQRVAGQRFYLEEFGFITDIAWADDIFGFPHSYPQILAKTGARYFYTNKFCYNEVNKFPYHTMIWKSPDGSSVLAYWMQHKNSWGNWLKTFKELSVLVKDGEHVELNYMSDFKEAASHFSDEPLGVIGNMYGEGDGGNGPTPVQIIEQLCWQEHGFSRLGMTKNLFALIEPFKNRLPVWNDELYLECHQGTLTSIHMIKENNHTAEVLLHAIEYLNVLGVLTREKDHQSEINDLWKIILFNQFHDVLPGSSIIEVYRDAAREYQTLYTRLYELRDAIGYAMQENQPNNSKGKATITIINDLSWSRSGIVTISLNLILKDNATPVEGLEFSVEDENSIQHPCQVVSFPHYDVNREFLAGLGKATGLDYMQNTNGTSELDAFIHPRATRYLWFQVPVDHPLESLGSRKFVISWKNKEMVVEEKVPASSSSSSGDILLENGLISVSVDNLTARITSITGLGITGCIKSAGIVLYDDPATKFDAWNIDPKYYEHQVALPLVNTITRDHTGPVVNSILLESNPSPYGTVYCHRIYLVAGTPIVYHDIYVNWQEDHKLLKYQVAPTFDTGIVRCGMQFGSIDRDTMATNRFTDYKVKYEYPTQEWNSVQGEVDSTPVIVVLLNRNKHGLFCKGSTMELSLLKAAKFEKWTSAATLDADNPRPILIDRGFHRLSVAIKIDRGDSQAISNWRAGIEFNTPFSSLQGQGTSIKPLVAIDPDMSNIEICTIKALDLVPGGANPHPDWYIRRDQGLTWILARIVEHDGAGTDVTLNLATNLNLEACAETDMLERQLAMVEGKERQSSVKIIGKNQVSMQLDPYEIKSIAIGFGSE